MIDLPVGKAIVAVESDVQCNFECTKENYNCPFNCCKGCELLNEELQKCPDSESCKFFKCTSSARRDGKNIIYKLIDYSYQY